ncbi:MAG: hypothetical protein H0U12_05680 [Thermoleophilaceae bacterium]|nr:hypothetical protein [Thermoleophilaceae bacterium]
MALAAVRLVNGGAALFAPEAYGRRLGVDPERNPGAPYVLRLFGVRTVIIGAELLVRRGDGLIDALRVGRVIHASDAGAAILAGVRGQLPPDRAKLAALVSSINTVLAFAARPRRR